MKRPPTRNPIPDYLRASPLWKVFLIVEAVSIAVWVGLGAIDGEPAGTGTRIAQGAVFGGVMTALSAWQRRRDPADTTLQVAVQDGRIPTDLEERQRLAVQIAQRQTKLRRARVTNNITIAVVIVVGLVSNSLIGNIYAVILVPLLAISAVFSHRRIGAQLTKLHALAGRLPPPDDQREGIGP